MAMKQIEMNLERALDTADGCFRCAIGAEHRIASHEERPCDLARRPLLKAAVWAAAGSVLPVGAPQALAEDTEASNARPQPGDLLVSAGGDKSGSVIAPDGLPLGGPQVLAWPMDPKIHTVRDGSRLNQVLLLRLDPASLDDETRQRATADGVVAYSAICTHALCPVTAWRHETKRLLCPCHESEYEPQNGGKVVAGPAPRPLPALPLKMGDDGTLIVAGQFTGRVGSRPT